jgi:hypothetical protein
MHVAFLTPIAALTILVLVLPIASLRAGRARGLRAQRALGLPRPSVGVRLAVPGAITLTLALVGVAAAQPVIQHGAARRARTDAEVYFVFDISRSMAAAQGPHAPDRLARAERFAVVLRGRLTSIPVGVASFTDRVLPLEFPTADMSSFASVVREALAINDPAPQRFYADRATSFDALAQFAQQDYFDGVARHRAIVVFTDGESAPVSPTLGDVLRRSPTVHVVFVHIAQPGDKVYRGSVPDPNYHADPASGAFLRRAARALHGTAVSEDLGSAASAVHAAVGAGPVKTLTEPSRLALMPYVTLAAFVPLAFVLWRRNV